MFIKTLSLSAAALFSLNAFASQPVYQCGKAKTYLSGKMLVSEIKVEKGEVYPEVEPFVDQATRILATTGIQISNFYLESGVNEQDTATLAFLGDKANQAFSELVYSSPEEYGVNKLNEDRWVNQNQIPSAANEGASVTVVSKEFLAGEKEALILNLEYSDWSETDVTTTHCTRAE